MSQLTGAAEFLRARDYLLAHRSDYELVCRNFSWPALDRFNWALDYFDVMAAGNSDLALWIADENGSDIKRTFAELSSWSNRVGNFLRALGAGRGDHVLVMLGNHAPLWEVLLAAMKLGAVVIPASPLLTTEDLRDRVERGHARHVVAAASHAAKFDELMGSYTLISSGGRVAGWYSLEDAA